MYIIYWTGFGYIEVTDDFHYTSILKRKCRIKLFTLYILDAWVIFECVENGENWTWIQIIQKIMIFLGMLSSEIKKWHRGRGHMQIKNANKKLIYFGGDDTHHQKKIYSFF